MTIRQNEKKRRICKELKKKLIKKRRILKNFDE